MADYGKCPKISNTKVSDKIAFAILLETSVYEVIGHLL